MGRVIQRILLWWRSGLKTYGVWWRLGTLAIVSVLVIAAVAPLVETLLTDRVYALSADSRNLVGTASATLASQLQYNAQSRTYSFNQSGVGGGHNTLAAQVGAASGKGDNKSLYALDVSQQFKKGVTYTDANTGLSFSMLPQFGGLDGKVISNHLVFPLEGNKQAVYTLKGNGLKEDIVVQKSTEDSLSFSYTVNLPKTLAIKMIPDGNGAVGIYSADPTLFGNVSYGSVSDQAAVQKARETSSKDHLLFGLPAPITRDLKGNTVGKSAFILDGNTLTVQATGLSGAAGPVTIDPSVVVTSSSDFMTGGNNEGNIDFSTAGQITRGGMTGGDISAWTATNSFTNGRESAATVAYNGYLYVMGGYQRSPNVKYSDIQYAPINSDGTIGTWQATTNLPAAYTHAMATVYNGYLYLVGGLTTGVVSASYVAKLNSNGTVGSWATTTSLPAALTDEGLVAYQGYMYALGGTTTQGSTCGANSSCLDTTYYAPINADGTLGSWVAMAALPVQVASMGAIANNGYMYIIGGANTAVLTSVYYAPINTDGTLGTWQATTSLTSGRYSMATYFYNGYLYTTAGYVGKTDTLYAPVYANGSVGAWTSSPSALTVGVTYPSYAVYGSALYILGGYNSSGTTDFNTTQYAKIQPAGYTTPFATLANNFTTARALACSVALNGYLYVIGGSTVDGGSNNVTTVQYSTLNSSTGNNGAWASTTALPAARGSAGCATYNGIVYVVAGYTGTSTSTKTIYYATQNSNGTLGAWTTATNNLAPADASNKPGVFIYANSSGPVMYVLGGCGSYGNGSCSQVYYAALNASTGAPGTWTQATNSMLNNYAARAYAQVGNYLYAIGGQSGSTSASTAVEYTSIDSSGVPGTWATTTSLPVAISWSLATTVNGCIYTLGGENGNSVNRAQVYYACPASNGTISGWNAAPSLTVATTDMGVTSYNGYLYGVGGYTSSVQTTTQFARVNNGGSGIAIPGTWTTNSPSLSTPYANGIAYAQSFVSNGYVYIVGGYNPTDGRFATTWSAPLNSDGTIGAWTQQTSMPSARSKFVVETWNGYVYAYTGVNSAGAVNNTYTYAKIGPNGTLGSWSSDQTMNLATGSISARGGAGGGVYNGYLYLLGGDDNNTTVYADTYYAALNPDGSVGTWQTGSSFATARTSVNSFAANGYLYIVGGNGNNVTPSVLGDTQVAPLNSGTGAVGTWRATVPLLQPRYNNDLVVANGYVYVYGGTNTSGGLMNLELAPLLAGGDLGRWETSNGSSLTTSHTLGVGVANNGYIYQLGGKTGAAYQTDIQYTPLNSVARVARYSKLIDIGVPANIANITSNGNDVSVTYRRAASNGVLGSQGPIAGANGVGPCVSGTDIGTRYVWLTASLDDSNTAVFPDTSAVADLTDITINYIPLHPTPSTRLRTGQTLQQGSALGALDTCAM